MFSMKIEQRDSGLLNHIRRVTNRYGATIEIGYLSGQMYKHPIGPRRPKKPKPISMAQLAMIHENGSNSGKIKIPARPFISPAMAKNERKHAALIKAQITPIFRRKKTIAQGWDEFGKVAISDIRDYMKVRDHFEPLSAITVWRKQSDFPLLDTGQLRQKLEFKVK